MPLPLEQVLDYLKSKDVQVAFACGIDANGKFFFSCTHGEMDQLNRLLIEADKYINPRPEQRLINPER